MSEQTEFQPGDLVQLKSGGAVMTVEGRAADEVLCVWHIDGLPERETYSKETLVKV
ncbi:MAG: hypothetical protein Kapaf2KO_22600 [Candidatus Kapaibacteriales bacterium]